MKIYGTMGNPFRVAVFLAEKGIEVEFEPVDLMGGAHKSAAFLKKNPTGQIPVLELDDGTCISETQAICRYFERSQPEPPLMGVGALDEAVVEMWQRRIELNLYNSARAVFRHSVPYMKALEPVQIPQWAELNRPKVVEALKMADEQLASNRFLAGDNFSVADITLLFCLQMTDRIGIPPAQAGDNIVRWYGEVSERPAVKSVLEAQKS